MESPGTLYHQVWFVFRLAAVLSGQGLIHVEGGLLAALPGGGDEV